MLVVCYGLFVVVRFSCCLLLVLCSCCFLCVVVICSAL